MLEPLWLMPRLQALSIVRARRRALQRPGIERLLAGLPHLERFAVSFDSRDTGTDVTKEWLSAVARSLRPRLVRCTLLPPGSEWEPW